MIQQRIDRLVDAVQEHAWQANQADLSTVVEVLVEGASKRDPHLLAGKTPKNQTVHAPIPAGVDIAELTGRFVDVEIDQAKTWYLSGSVVDGSLHD